MICKLKNLGVAIVATLALAAMAAPAASAAEFHTGLVYELSGSLIEGEDSNTFKAGTVRCTTINYVGEIQTATSSTLTLTPSFSGCTAFGFVGTTIDTNGCTYVFHSNEGGRTSIACPAGKSIAITAYNCEVTIGSQSLGSVSYANEESEGSSDIRINTNLTAMSYTQHTKKFPGCTNGSFNDGTYTGTVTLNVTVIQPGIWYE